MLDLDNGRLPLKLMWVLSEVKQQGGFVIAEIQVGWRSLEAWLTDVAPHLLLPFVEYYFCSCEGMVALRKPHVVKCKERLYDCIIFEEISFI